MVLILILIVGLIFLFVGLYIRNLNLHIIFYTSKELKTTMIWTK